MRKPPQIKLNAIDKVRSFFSAEKGVQIYRDRAKIEFFNSYTGASKTRRSIKEFMPGGGDADSDILYDLPSLRERSRDLIRNNPIARGAIKTKVTKAIGTGLIHHAMIDREALGLTDEQADAVEAVINRRWLLFWDTKNVDAARTLNGRALTKQVYEQEKTNGDALITLPHINRGDAETTLKLQVVETDRLTNKNNAIDTEEMSGGVQKDTHGAPSIYWVQDQHPGATMPTKFTWTGVPAYGQKTGLPNAIHFFSQERPGQSRGVPDLAPVIEPLKQLGTYSQAEIDAAVISSFFTVFIETESGDTDFDYSKLGDETGQKSTDKDLKLGSGLIVGLGEGEKIHDSNPGRPNANFDPFFVSIVRQIGVGLQIPFEILIKHYTSSYTAARASVLDFWDYIKMERAHIVDDFLMIVKEVWMYEEVVNGNIYAPGFLTSLSIRKAYLGAEWVGPVMGQIREDVEVKAAVLRVDNGLSTMERETTLLTGGDWKQNHKQQVKENNARIADGLKKVEVEENEEQIPG